MNRIQIARFLIDVEFLYNSTSIYYIRITHYALRITHYA
jgi:hypothetical protein